MADKTTAIVKVFKGKSALVYNLPSDEIYTSFNIWIGNSGYASLKNIENPVFYFKVEKVWMQEIRIDRSSIALNRYNDGKWGSLQITILKEDNEFTCLTLETAGFLPLQ